MIHRLASHLRRQALGAIALFLVLAGGTAFALPDSNTVSSDDITNGEVKVPDLATGAVTSSKLLNDEIRSIDVRDDTLTGGGLAAADLRPGSVGSSEVLDDSLTGADVDEASLGEVPGALFADDGSGEARWSFRSDGESCSGNDPFFKNCHFVALTLPVTSPVLVLATVVVQDDGVEASAECRLSTSEGVVPETTIAVPDNGLDFGPRWMPQSLTAVTQPLGPGPIEVKVQCRDTGGFGEYLYPDFWDVNLAAIPLLDL